MSGLTPIGTTSKQPPRRQHPILTMPLSFYLWNPGLRIQLYQRCIQNCFTIHRQADLPLDMMLQFSELDAGITTRKSLADRGLSSGVVRGVFPAQLLASLFSCHVPVSTHCCLSVTFTRSHTSLSHSIQDSELLWSPGKANVQECPGSHSPATDGLSRSCPHPNVVG
jgi:hypothetical protein